tara:strand:+ start:5192 stop:6598 length:1407 start_codon:yes stop_codon:yes gene_type:complete
MNNLIFLTIVFCLFNLQPVEGQILKKLKEKIKSIENTAKSAPEVTVDKASDKVVGNINNKIDTSTENTATKTGDAINKPIDNLTNSKNIQNENIPDTSIPVADENNETTSVQTDLVNKTTYYSKFDFIPGEKLIVFDDYTEDVIGDFPAKWFTDGSGEIVSLEGYEGKWLMMKGRSEYFIDELLQLPDNFTIQFDLMCSIPFSWSSGIINFELRDLNDFELYKKDGDMYASQLRTPYYFRMQLHPGLDNPGGYNSTARGAYVTKDRNANVDLKEIWMPTTVKNLLHVSIWRQKERLRVYLNENKMLDLPKILPTEMNPNIFIWRTEGFEDDDHYFISNLRIAVGNPDTRSKLLTEGKLVTNGILFAVNSDDIKPESFGVLKEIATILKESGDIKVIIVGHTDSDGDENKNLELSKKRAQSVKQALTSEFNVKPENIETNGKGESKPIVPNSNNLNKAQNRRVEFIINQ